MIYIWPQVERYSMALQLYDTEQHIWHCNVPFIVFSRYSNCCCCWVVATARTASLAYLNIHHCMAVLDHHFGFSHSANDRHWVFCVYMALASHCFWLSTRMDVLFRHIT